MAAGRLLPGTQKSSDRQKQSGAVNRRDHPRRQGTAILLRASWHKEAPAASHARPVAPIGQPGACAFATIGASDVLHHFSSQRTLSEGGTRAAPELLPSGSEAIPAAWDEREVDTENSLIDLTPPIRAEEVQGR
jgi:hypothetical protein